MNADQVIEGVGKAVAAAKPAQEYCFLWIDHWSTCMTKNEWSGWMQAFGVVFTVASGIWLLNRQLNVERKLQRNRAAALLNTFGGALNAVAAKLPANGTRSQWDIRMMRVLLESELKRSNEIPLQVLSPDEQRGVFAFRLSAFQILEALRIAEPEVVTGPSGEALVSPKAYAYLLGVIRDGQTALQNGRALLGEQVEGQTTPSN